MPGAEKVGKICCQCGRDVSGSPRVKDSQGQYWCMPCNEADKLRRMQVESGICQGCGMGVGKNQLITLAGVSLCPACRERKFRFGAKSTPRDKGSIVAGIKSLFGK